MYPLNYGVPEYVSPEAAFGEGTGLPHDMWSVGIITYILLSGRSPFRGRDDRETLLKIQEGKWSFDESWWKNISAEAKDFISKLLVFQADGRLDVHAALRHPWLERADRQYSDEFRIHSRYLTDYYKLFRYYSFNNALRCHKAFRLLENGMIMPPAKNGFDEDHWKVPLLTHPEWFIHQVITHHLHRSSVRQLLRRKQDHPLGKTSCLLDHLSITKLASSNPKASKHYCTNGVVAFN